MSPDVCSLDGACQLVEYLAERCWWCSDRLWVGRSPYGDIYSQPEVTLSRSPRGGISSLPPLLLPLSAERALRRIRAWRQMICKSRYIGQDMDQKQYLCPSFDVSGSLIFLCWLASPNMSLSARVGQGHNHRFTSWLCEASDSRTRRPWP